MIRRFAALLTVGFLAWLMARGGLGTAAHEGVEIAFMVGFVLLAAHLFGILGEQAGLPRITGYIFAGILVGPFVLNLLGSQLQESLQIFNHMAYAFIGFAAGEGLRFSALKRRARAVILQVVLTTGFVYVGVVAVAILLAPFLPPIPGATFLQIGAVAGLLGVIATANSPSSAIAIISDTRASGPFTDTVLGVTMAKDLLIIPFFFVTLSFALHSFQPGTGPGWGHLLTIFLQIAVAVGFGVFLGWLLSLYIGRGGPQLSLVVIGTCFLVYKLSTILEVYLQRSYGWSLHPEPLLICAVAGFSVRNIFGRGEGLARAMDSIGLPVYVVFFTLAGAGLDIGAVIATWGIALVLFLARGVTMAFGSYAAARLVGDPPAFRRRLWMGFIPQAGLSIALSIQIGEAFPGWGEGLTSLLVAIIALNQIAGPILFQFALEGVGETRKARRAKIKATLAKGRPA